MSEMVLILISFFSIVVVAVSVIVPILLFYRLENMRPVAELRRRISKLEGQATSSRYISDQVSNVLFDLYEFTSSVKAYIDLTRQGYSVGDEYFDVVNTKLLLLEKHFFELDLFSPDPSRRKSAQQALAASLGDISSMEIMQRIVNGEIGVADDQLGWAIRTLRSRIEGTLIIADSRNWTGR